MASTKYLRITSACRDPTLIISIQSYGQWDNLELKGILRRHGTVMGKKSHPLTGPSGIWHVKLDVHREYQLEIQCAGAGISHVFATSSLQNVKWMLERSDLSKYLLDTDYTWCTQPRRCRSVIFHNLLGPRNNCAQALPHHPAQ